MEVLFLIVFLCLLFVVLQSNSVVLESLRKLKLMSLNVDILKVGFWWISVEVLYGVE